MIIFLNLRGRDLVIDAADPLSCIGRYINDSLSLNLKKTNSRWKTYDNTHSAAIISTKDIRKGSEIYIKYGLKFWTEPKRYDKLSTKEFVDNREEDDDTANRL